MLYWLKHEKNYIYLLQEKYLGTDQNKIIWYKEWGGKSCWVNNRKKSKGLSVLINPECDYNVLSVNNAGDERIIFLEIDGTDRLINSKLYAPNRHELKPHSRKTTETGRAEILKLISDYEMCDIY